MNKTGIAIHGGAGTILKASMTDEKELMYKDSLRQALEEGWELIQNGNSATDAVVKAVEILENNPLFNAGKGSVFTNSGKHEMDASVMEGKYLNAGAVSSVSNIKNPILLAKEIMDHPDYVYLSGKGALDFAEKHNLIFEKDEYFFDQYRYDQLCNALKNDKTMLDHTIIGGSENTDDDKEKKFGTVGAVALDINGNLAAATSTGGLTNKKFGRIGDSPLIGSGTYANNNTCAVSCTGEGEFFIRAVCAYDVSALMEYGKLSLENACEEVVNRKLVSIKGEGGLIAIDKDCNIAMPFNSKGMYRAFIKSGKKPEIFIYRD
ncbi:MAG TPA: isoaspartyl peptidase/L-asparaginase [Ignavibacteria bacterium]|nr:isoaspartyl peptidase/L-asparaginase [Ignavibacteria bacterium]HMR39628.1 isoaspartyl peptidase/L-asparaginase [Ignavibacteria bacterium]